MAQAIDPLKGLENKVFILLPLQKLAVKGFLLFVFNFIFLCT